MRLLIDENISPRVNSVISDLFPNSQHVSDLALQSASDQKIWNYAKINNFSILTKDSDFHHKSSLLGSPPKVIWITSGNCSTNDIINLIIRYQEKIKEFINDSETDVLILR